VFAVRANIRYPKPGNPNPLVSVQTFSLKSFQASKSYHNAKQTLTWPGQLDLDKRIIMEVGWAADDALIVKEIDRSARNGSVVLFESGSSTGLVVRKLGKEGEERDDGWIDHVSCSIVYMIV
jgi:dipeptidyl aminopeptidase